MIIDNNWFKLYEQIYGKEFNRLLTIGNGQEGYVNYTVNNLEELKQQLEEFKNHEFYISAYNYLSDENIIKWNSLNIEKYEKYAEKTSIILRFRQNMDIIQEETTTLSDIQQFMFIRRSINLGFNKQIINDTQKAYNFFKNHLNIKGMLLFNGYNECILQLPKEDIMLKNPSLTYYNLLKLMKEKLELKTLVYENVEPYAQLTPLPGTQNKHSRLYVQLYHPQDKYEDIMKNAQNKFFDSSHLKEVKLSDKLHQFLKDLDKETDIHKNDSKYDFDKIWDKYNK